MGDKSQILDSDNQFDCRPSYPDIIHSNDTEYDLEIIHKLFHELTSLHKYIGARYLEEIISKPNSTIHATDLRNLFNESKKAFDDLDIETTDENQNFVCELKCYNYSSNPLNELPIEAADKEAINQVYKHMQNTIEALHLRQSYNDLAAVDDLLDEIEKCKQWLAKACNNRGKPRYLVNQGNKDYQSVTKAIKFVVELLRAKDPELGKQCDEHLVLGVSLSWRAEAMK
jgi:DNA repair ATPase RecN